MLKHEDNPQASSPSAAQVRVTPEELAAAITALQIRKDGQPGTIAIGDAVEELGLDVTPEEVLAEVEARRQVKPKRRLDYRALVCAIVCAVPLALGGFMNLYSHSNSAVKPAPPQAHATTLSDVGNEQQVYVDTHGLKQLIGNDPSSQVRVYLDNQGIRWGIIKHDSKVYVQAYTLQVSEGTFTSKPSVFVNSEDHYATDGAGFDESGTLYAAERVTLPVKALHVDDSEQTAKHAQITVSGLRADNHLWDEFKDRFSQ